MFPLSLRGPIGFDLDNAKGDFSAAAEGLEQLGYPEAMEAAATGEWGGDIGWGLRQYQRERGLTVDGWAAPGGETEVALNEDLISARTGMRAIYAREAKPSRDEVDWSAGSFVISPSRKNELAVEAVASSPVTKSSAVALEERGYRYRPDPMGWVGEGDWLDSRGRALARDEQERIGREVEGARSRNPARRFSPYPVQSDDASGGDGHVTIEIEDDEAGHTDEDEGATENGPVEPANLLDRLLQGVFGRGNRQVWLRQGKLPPLVKKRVDQIKSEKTRRAVEALLDGSDDETRNPNNQNAISALKRSGKYGAHFDFGRFMTRMGMRNSDAIDVFEDGKKDEKKSASDSRMKTA